MGDTTFGESSSIILLILSPELTAGVESACIEMALVLIHLLLVILNAFATRDEMTINTTIEKKLMILNMFQKDRRTITLAAQ
jgi:hypothetical protein